MVRGTGWGQDVTVGRLLYASNTRKSWLRPESVSVPSLEGDQGLTLHANGKTKPCVGEVPNQESIATATVALHLSPPGRHL